ncbi:MAG: outer membrane beta-barrel protein [Bdellovibrionales bacterium]|nr:outer membrane beta-barrel protein [Oligoflexia bacterium]
MKKLITTLALAAFIASPAFAATKKKTTIHNTTSTTTPAVDHTERNQPITTATTSNNGDGFPTPRSHASPEFAVSLGLGTIYSRFVFGVGFKAQWPVEMDGNDFKFGGQTGFYLAPSSTSTFIIPFLGTAEYEFRTSNSLKPYIGVGLGLTIAKASGFDSSTDFGFLFIPGVNCEDGHYFAEIPIGTLGGGFAVLPSVGMHF